MFGKRIECSFDYGKMYTIYVMNAAGGILKSEEINTVKDNGNTRLDKIVSVAKRELKSSREQKLTLVISEVTTRYTIRVRNEETKISESFKADTEEVKDMIIHNIHKFAEIRGEVDCTKDTTVRTVLIAVI
jgi:hypothetical protein